METSPEKIVQALLADKTAKSLLQGLIAETVSPKDVPPSEVIPLEYVKDAWMEFNDQLDPGNVPWSEVPDHLVEEMVKYLKAMFRGNQDPAKEPSTHLVKQRIKRYYRAQRQQKLTASSPTRRRRRRFQNRKNRLTMEKRDKEMDKANRQGALNGLSTEEIFERRERISPVKSKAVAVPPDSDDEDAKRDLLCRRKLFLKNARKVASARRAKARLLLEAVERPGGSHLQVRDLLKLTESSQANPQIPVVPSPPDKVFVPESPLSSQN